MKKYICSLLSLLILTSLVLAGYGAYVKYEVLQPLGLYQDKNIIELPFLLHTDAALQYMVRLASAPVETTQTPTQPTQAPTLSETQPPTEPEERPTKPALPETQPPPVQVEESWFDDALFIGNSLTVGLRDYAPLGKADYFCSIGMNVFSVYDTWARDWNYRYVSLQQLLQRKSYGKIYIHMGTNECGYPLETILAAYQDLIDFIRSYQPDAQIIVQAMMSFGRAKARQYSYMVPDTAIRINEALRTLAQQNGALFIDFNPQVVDEENYLPDLWSGDGCHPTVEGYRQWSDWILDTAGDLGIP